MGLGNVWRFPYVAGENGGGTFLIPYLIALVFCGAPLLVYEIAAGRYYRQGIIGTMQSISPRLWILGAVVALIGFVLLSYYLVITGWTLGYLVQTPLGATTSFDNFASSWSPVVFFFLALAIALTIVVLGVSRGIENASKLLLPLLAAIVVGLAAYGLTLDGSNEALTFLFKPEFGELMNVRVWAEAFGQAFFSLGVGMGVLLTYGSYMGERDSIPGAFITIASADTLVALLAGLVVFPIVFTFGFSPAEGPQLAFDTLPAIFETVRFGTALGTAFYLLLFTAATTSAVSLLQTLGAALSDRWGWSPVRGAITLAIPLAGLGSLSALSYSPVNLTLAGARVLDVMDSSIGTYGLLLGGLITSGVLFWAGKPDLLLKQVHGQGHSWKAKTGLALGKYILPAALVATLGAQGISALLGPA